MNAEARDRMIVTRWRAAAERIDAQAQAARDDGDPLHAAELNAAAADYRRAADAIEYDLEEHAQC